MKTLLHLSASSCAVALLSCAITLSSTCRADLIQLEDIKAIPLGLTNGSGNGSLDLRLFSSSTAENNHGAFDIDDGNTSLPSGAGGGDNGSFAESYVTSGAELKAFFALNEITEAENPEIALWLDLDESGATAKATNTLSKLEVMVFSSTEWGANPSPIGADLTSAQQGAIDQMPTTGTMKAELGFASVNLPQISQGAGAEDYSLLTGVNPFALNDNDIVLFNISMSNLSNGGEEWFVSGTFASSDIAQLSGVPEPSSLLLGAILFWFGLISRKHRRPCGAKPVLVFAKMSP